MRPGPAGWHRGGSGLVKQHVDRWAPVERYDAGACLGTEPWSVCVISAFLCFPAVRTVCACACLSVLSRRRGLCACLSS